MAPGTPERKAATWLSPASSKSARTAIRHPSPASREIAAIYRGDSVPFVQSNRTPGHDAAISAAAIATEGFSVTKTHCPFSPGIGHRQEISSRGGSVTAAPAGRVQPTGTTTTETSPPVRSSQSTPASAQLTRGRSRGLTLPAAKRIASTSPDRGVPSSRAWGEPAQSEARRWRSIRTPLGGSPATTVTAVRSSCVGSLAATSRVTQPARLSAGHNRSGSIFVAAPSGNDPARCTRSS